MRTASTKANWLSGVACLLAGCASVDTAPLPTDAIAQLLAQVNEARDAARAQSALGWSSGNVSATDLVAQPAGVDTFTDAMCENALFSTLIAVRKLNSFNEEVAELAKAPEDSFAAYSASIKRSSEAIKAAQDGATKAPSQTELTNKEADRCRRGVARDLAVNTEGVSASNFLVVDAFQKLIAIPQLLMQIHEAKQRVEAVRHYILANEQELSSALDALGNGGLLQESLSVSRRQTLRKAFVAFSDARRGAPGMARVHAAEDFSRYAAQYQKIRDVEGGKLIEDKDEGLRAAYGKLIENARNPNGNPLRALDGFLVALKNVTDLRDAVGDFKKARKDAAG